MLTRILHLRERSPQGSPHLFFWNSCWARHSYCFRREGSKGGAKLVSSGIRDNLAGPLKRAMPTSTTYECEEVQALDPHPWTPTLGPTLLEPYPWTHTPGPATLDPHPGPTPLDPHPGPTPLDPHPWTHTPGPTPLDPHPWTQSPGPIPLDPHPWTPTP